MRFQSVEKAHCLIVGAMKAGTTEVFDCLRQLSTVDTPPAKDTKFFVGQSQGGSWHLGCDWYREQFGEGGSVNVEASTQYTKLPDIPDVVPRMRATLRDVRVVYLVRNPIERALSHYFHNVVVDGVAPDFEKAFGQPTSKYYRYSDYLLQLSPYLEAFAPEAVLPTNYVDSPAKQATLDEIASFAIGHSVRCPRPSAFARRNSLSALAQKMHPPYGAERYSTTWSCWRTMMGDIAAWKGGSRVEMALDLGFRRAVLQTMAGEMQERYDRFASVVDWHTTDWVSRYGQHL